MGIFSDAFPNARLRARKSRLRGPDALRRLRRERSPAALAEELCPGSGGRPQLAPAMLFEGLLGDYEFMIRSYPRAESLWRALLGIHEIENVKLGWRARARELAASRWARLWKPLGRLESVRFSDWSTAPSLREAVRASASTPYGPILKEVLEAHELDLAGADLALDRWAWARVVSEARRLPRAEHDASQLVLALARERDYDFVRRAHASGRLPAEGAAAGAVLVGDEQRPETLRALAAWRLESGPFPTPRRSGSAIRIGGWNDFTEALESGRRARCRRAFRSYPFRLAPPVAFLFLREAEVRAVSALLRGAGKGTERTGEAGLPLSRAATGPAAGRD